MACRLQYMMWRILLTLQQVIDNNIRNGNANYRHTDVEKLSEWAKDKAEYI